MGDSVAMVVISCSALIIGCNMDSNTASVVWWFIAIIFGFFGLGKIRLEFQRYSELSYPVIEIYNKMKSDTASFTVTDTLAVYHGENGDIEYTRYIPGGIVNYDMQCFTLNERTVLEKPFRDVLVAANEATDKKQIQCEKREGFANIFGISKDSNEKNKF